MKIGRYVSETGTEYQTNKATATLIESGWDSMGVESYDWHVHDYMPCSHKSNTLWMTQGFLSVHQESLRTLWNPCAVCQFQAIVYVITDDGERWILSESHAGMVTLEAVKKESELLALDTDLTDEWIYAGSV